MLGRGGDTRTGGVDRPMARRTVLTSSFNRRAISFFGTPSTRCRWRTSAHWVILITSASSWLGRRDDRVSPRRSSPGAAVSECSGGPFSSGHGVPFHVAATILASAGEIPTGLDAQIDTPRVYRGEQLPRALPWDTVRALLDSIDRATPMGRRDYAIFLLMATYGLRACEVVTLTLDDVEWRAGRLRIPQRKTRGSLWLPLTDEGGTALLDYLRHGRHALTVRRQRVPFRGGPPRSYRELFLRCRTPTGVLKPTAVTEAFQAWSKPQRPRHSVPGTPLRAALVCGAPLAVRPAAQDDRGPPGPSHARKHVRVSPLGGRGAR